MHWIALQPLHEPQGDARRHDPDPAVSAAATGPSDGETPADGIVASPDPQALVDDLQALGWWGLRFTPRVVVQGPAQAVLLEVSASERLFGGRRQLITEMLAAGRPLAHIRVARAPTALLALARLQLEPAAGRAPDQLPLHTLAEARPHLATLDRLGCQTWGDLRALPRGGVVRRFGAALLDALDRAYGLKPEVYPWLVLPEVFDVPLELQAQVEAAPALLFAARRLLAQLQVWLQARQRGVLAFELRWQMDARRDTASEGALVVRTAVPTLDMAHLQRLLAENLDRITLPAPVLYLHLRTIETAALSGATTSLLPDEQRKGDALAHLLERLAARLGPEQVLRAMACADHRPEHMQAWLPAADAGMPDAGAVRVAGRPAGHPLTKGKSPAMPSTAPGGVRGNGMGRSKDHGNSDTSAARARAGGGSGGGKGRAAARPAFGSSDALYPTWLLATPLRLAVRQDRPIYQGPLTLLAGPQRLEAAWWDVVLTPAAAPPMTPQVREDRPSDARSAPPPVAEGVAPAAPARQATSRLALRDYFLARSAQAGLLWIYRERLMTARVDGDKPVGQWYLHGVFG
jgi:protein ImuB